MADWSKARGQNCRHCHGYVGFSALEQSFSGTVHHGKLLCVSHGIETTSRKIILHFSRLAAAPLPLFDPLSRFYGLGTQSLQFGTSLSTFLWQNFRGQGTPGSHAIEKLCTQLNDFASRSKAGKQKTTRQIDRQMLAVFFLILQMSFKCWQFWKLATKLKWLEKTSSCGGSWVRAGPFAGKVANHAGSLRIFATRRSCWYQTRCVQGIHAITTNHFYKTQAYPVSMLASMKLLVEVWTKQGSSSVSELSFSLN